MKLYTANELLSIYEEEKKSGYVSAQYETLKAWADKQKEVGLDSNLSVIAFRRII